MVFFRILEVVFLKFYYFEYCNLSWIRLRRLNKLILFFIDLNLDIMGN